MQFSDHVASLSKLAAPTAPLLDCSGTGLPRSGVGSYECENLRRLFFCLHLGLLLFLHLREVLSSVRRYDKGALKRKKFSVFFFGKRQNGGRKKT